MFSPKILLSAALLLLLCACGPPSSSDPAAKDMKLVTYEPDEEKITASTQDIQSKMTALRARLLDVKTDYSDLESVASGTTDKTEQRAGGTERMQNLPDEGANVGQSFDSITAINRDLLGGARYLGAQAENFSISANAQINEARSALSIARAENKWTDEEVKTYEAPIIAAEAALEELMNSRKSLTEQLTNGEDVIMDKREETPGTPNQN